MNADLSVLHHVNDFFAAHDAIEDPVVSFTNASEVLFLAMLVLAFVVVGGRRRHGTRRAVVAAGLSAAVALAIGQVISRIVDRPRPFVAHHDLVHLFSRHAADPGFPSDHATAAFAIAVALLLRERVWGLVVLVAAIIVSVARVGMGIHYPTDILAGAALGTLVALALWHPAVRVLLHRLADFAGSLLDGVLAAVLRRAPSA